MKILLSLRRHKGQRLSGIKGDVRPQLVDFFLARADGYRVARAQCCVIGSVIAVLWEPTLVRVEADAFLFQGFEKVGEQTVVPEWVVKPYVAGARP